MTSYWACKLRWTPSEKIMIDKMKKQHYKLDNITSIHKNMMDNIQISKYSSYKMDLTKDQDPNAVVPANKKAPQFNMNIL